MKAFLRELGLRFWVTVCVYLSILCVSFYLAYELRFDFALPPEMRRRYARHMVSLLAPGTAVLLIALDYPQAEMDGPPFAVSPAEVEDLYAADFSIAAFAGQDILAESPGLRARGLTRLTERAYHLVRR